MIKALKVFINNNFSKIYFEKEINGNNTNLNHFFRKIFTNYTIMLEYIRRAKYITNFT